MKRVAISLIVVVLLTMLSACGEKNAADDEKTILIGTTGGPFNFLLKRAVVPKMEEKGYRVSFFEYQDIDELNNDLLDEEIDLNLFQNEAYLDVVKQEYDVPLSKLVEVPTEPIGLFSEVYGSLEEIEDGATVTVPNDPVNLPVALQLLQKAGLIQLDPSVELAQVTEENIVENSKHLRIQPILFTQLPIALHSAELSVVPGALAITADLDLKDALALEEVPAEFQYIFAIPTEKLEEPFAKDLVEAIQSDAFAEVIQKENIYYVEKKKEKK